MIVWSITAGADFLVPPVSASLIQKLLVTIGVD